ncbi:hypothetical protein [Cognatiyoonia koreensis]|nr:hypothetical protein [Cognatiyoonia koreensis]
MTETWALSLNNIRAILNKAVSNLHYEPIPDLRGRIAPFPMIYDRIADI